MKWLIVTFLAALLPLSVNAQAPKPRPLTGNLINDIRQRTDSNTALSPGASSGNFQLPDLIGAFDAKVKPDLEIALALATRTNNTLTKACWEVWLKDVNARLDSMPKDDQGNPIDLPTPHILTDFERIMEIRAALDPDGDFSKACLPVALKVGMDLQRMVGAVATGGILSLAKFAIPGL